MASRSLNVTITGDTKGLQRAVGDADRSLGRFGKSADDANRRGGKALSGLGAVGKTGLGAVAAAAGTAAAGMVAFAKVSVDAANDINESVTKNRTLFGDYAKDIEAFAKSSATSFGISRKAALEYTGVFGNLARAIGISQRQSAQMSVELTKLAADLASFNNTSIEDALEALRSGLTGETEPMRRFGVALSATAVEAEAVRAGIVKLASDGTKVKTFALQLENAQRKAAEALKEHGKASIEYRQAANGVSVAQDRLKAATKGTVPDLNAQQKALATVSLITRQTRIAQGDFARTSGGLANQQRILTARIEDLKASLGEALLPTVTKVITRLNTFITQVQKGSDAGGDFRRVVEGVGPVVRDYADAALDVVNALKPYVNATKDVVEWTSRHKRVLQALDAVTRDPIENMRTLAGILNAVAKAAGFVVRQIDAAAGRLQKIAGVAKDAAGFLNPFGDGLGKMGDGIGDAIPAFGGSLMGARASMAPVAGIASRFGLHVSSGLRRGAMTSSGNRSYHSSGEALDIAGSSAGMLGFFRYMKNTMGGRLAELIHTPGGAGIRNGSPFTYGGQVARDHYDHVHVAIDTGAPGVGDGIGQIRDLWTRAGGRASAADMAAAIAMAESSGNPTASHRNSNGSIDRGLWQINSIHGALSTFDRLGNARAAVRISGNGTNWNPWTVYRTGAYRQFLGGGTTTSATKPGGGSTVKKGRKAPGPSADDIRYDPSSIYNRERTSADIRAGRGGAYQPPPSIKGLTDEERAIIAARPEPEAGPTELDYLDLALAEAEATTGTADDIAALGGIVGYRQRALAAARAGGDPRLISQARRDLTGAENALKELTDALKANTEALEEQKRQYETLIAQDYQRKYNVSQSQYSVLSQAVADAANGQLGQRIGLGLSGLRAPAGSVVRA